MVAAAKLRRAQDAAENARPYAARMAAVIANLAAASPAPARRSCSWAPARGQRNWWWSPPPTAASPAGSIPRSSAPRATISALHRPGPQVSVLTVGRKARDQLRRL